ncbi:neutral zinc metallopeptidase [Nocardiopsis sp. EMB25]|uniref:neutral zinc metallopeptidase n=1 Tax=Nocardiopsis sp. EMB25 TaxID=2835867 RepID=UPI002283923C|nr:neutral zinc metallopeptidase [Nocardiopsis sp. EMB25]MCY9786140.1 neutral zinc metallopeptidase [Nocardiopsis sp. EMB25]
MSGVPGPAERQADRRVLGTVAALLSLLLALAVLSWSSAEDGSVAGPPPGAGGTDADAAGVPDRSTSDGSAAGVVSRNAEQRQRPSGRAALVANPLYDTGRLSPLPCPVPEPDVDRPESMEVFLHKVADCLDDAWSTQFARAGIPFEPPLRVFWEQPGVSPCRSYPSPAGAFYCRASRSIYIGTADVVEKWNGATESVVYASLLAHEYAHHVQGESGLLDYYHEQRRQEDDVLERNSWTRRSELQANCLAGAFLGSVRVGYPLDDDDLDALLDDAAATADREDGDEAQRTHGSADNGVWWTRRGWEEQTPGACNTWGAADESLVQ